MLGGRKLFQEARRFAGAIALEMGRGGVSRVVELTEMSHLTINKGIRELKNTEKLEVPERLRSSGGGRERIEDNDPGIIADLEKSWTRTLQATT